MSHMIHINLSIVKLQHTSMKLIKLFTQRVQKILELVKKLFESNNTQKIKSTNQSKII